MSGNRKKQQEIRVTNPFGAAPAAGLFGASAAGAGTFGAPASTFGTFGANSSGTFASSSMFGAPAIGTTAAAPTFGSFGGVSTFGNVASSPFGGQSSLTLTEAVQQYKTELLKKKVYPFSCFGLPDQAPVLPGDISPAELRWYLENRAEHVLKAVADRAQILGEDLTEFLRAAVPPGTTIQRSGPYSVPAPSFPPFVPRTPFEILSSASGSTLTEQEITEYQDRRFTDEIPLLPPPVEFR